MKNLYLHIGHSKTGSSYLQSLFAANVETLRAHGVHYPAHPNMAEAAAGRVSSGNGRQLVQSLKKFGRGARGVNRHLRDIEQSVLLSSEALLAHLMESDQPSRLEFAPSQATESAAALERMAELVEWSKAHGFESIRFLLFIRDPVSHFQSVYQQFIKRAGSTADVESATRRYRNPKTVLYFLQAVEAFEETEVVVRNYSVARDNLVEMTCEWLGIPFKSVTPPPAAVVNRSMTLAELELQRALNGVLGPSGDLLSDPLCNELPHIAAGKLYPSEEAQVAMWKRLQPVVQEANKRIDPEHHYRFDQEVPQPLPSEYTFNSDQLRVIGSSIGASIAQLRQAAASQKGETGNPPAGEATGHPSSRLSARVLSAIRQRAQRLRSTIGARIGLFDRAG